MSTVDQELLKYIISVFKILETPRDETKIYRLLCVTREIVKNEIVYDKLKPLTTIDETALTIARQLCVTLKNTTGADVVITYGGADYTFTNNKSYLLFPEIAEFLKKESTKQGNPLVEVDPTELNTTGDKLFILQT